MPKSNNGAFEQSLLDKGLKIIICAFNEQKKEYSQNISQLETEIKKLKEENYIYKNKLSVLQKKLNTLSKTVCVLDIEAEEAKNQVEKKLSESKKAISTLNDEYNNINYNNKKKKKNNSVSNKFTLYKNFLLQNKNYNLGLDQYENSNPKTYSNNFQYNLTNMIDSPKNTSYNKVLENLNYLKKKKNNYFQNEASVTNNSYLMDKEAKDNDINLCEDSRTERKKIFSQKYLDTNRNKHIKDNILNKKMNEIINNNSASSINGNNLNDINENEEKRNDDDICHKSNENSNLCSKNINSEEEIFFKDMKISGDNNSKLYKRLNVFLEECKVKLNALDYENVIDLLKSFEIDSNIDIKKKVKKILNNNHKLCKLFDNIFEP